MSDTLKNALAPDGAAVEAGLAEAVHELQELRVRQRELEQLIARARATLGLVDEPAPAQVPLGRVTLHDAIAHVLNKHGGEGMTAREIVDAIEAGGLYRKRNGSRLEANQIHARVHKYSTLFEKDGSRIRLTTAN